MWPSVVNVVALAVAGSMTRMSVLPLRTAVAIRVSSAVTVVPASTAPVGRVMAVAAPVVVFTRYTVSPASVPAVHTRVSPTNINSRLMPAPSGAARVPIWAAVLAAGSMRNSLATAALSLAVSTATYTPVPSVATSAATVLGVAPVVTGKKPVATPLVSGKLV